MAEVLNRFLSGNLSQQSGGYLLRLPYGSSGRQVVPQVFTALYGEAHPDYRILDPEGRSITVENIRGLRDFLGTRPLGGGMKTLLVVAAHRMNTAAANAFLKSLEEPTKSTRIILITDRPWVLPTTILSRCHKLNMELSKEQISKEIVASFEEDIDPSKIEAAYLVTEGNAAAAAEVVQHDLSAWLDRVKGWLESPKPELPVAPGSGKDAPSLETLFLLLQLELQRTLLSEGGINGWSPEKAERALTITNKMSRGCARAGLDWKTRIGATLTCLAYQTEIA